MTTVNFSIPEDIKREFNELFAGENKSAVLTQLLRDAIESRKRARRRSAAVERILQLRETAPTATDKQRRQARTALRK